MNWESEINEFRNYLRLEKGLSDNSIHAYITDLYKLVSYLRSNGLDNGPETVTLNELKGLIEWISNRGISPRTQARIISELSLL